MSILGTLTAQHEEVPAWLNGIKPDSPLTVPIFKALLQSRVVFYPGSDCRDGLAFESFTHAHAAHCMIHADVGTDLDAVVNEVTGIPGSVPSILGYRPKVLQRLTREEALDVLQLNEQRVPGLDDPNPMAQEPALGGAVWSILERNPNFGDQHGPARLAFLHVKCEAAWLFWNLWLLRSPAPPPFAIIVSPEYGGSIERLFGTNGAAYRLEGGSARLPDWILYDRPVNELQPKLEAEWPEYEVAANDQGLRPTTLLRRRPDDHPLVVAARLRSTDFDAYWLHCLEHGLQPDYL
jgi:hypothetical protein